MIVSLEIYDSLFEDREKKAKKTRKRLFKALKKKKSIKVLLYFAKISLFKMRTAKY